MSQQKFGIGAVPGTPETGYVTIYPKADKRMYGKDALGVEFSLGATASTDALPEGATNLYFTNERAQDAALGVLADSADIDFTYNDAGNSASAVLTTSGASAGTYGSASQSAVVTVDAKGRVTSISETPTAALANTDALPEGLSNLYFTTERAQDAAFSALSDSADIDFTYNDAGNSATAVLTTSGTAGTYGSASSVPVLTQDSKGRLTNVTDTPIAILASAVTALTGLAEQYGFVSASDTLLQAIAKLGYSSCLQKNVITTSATVNDGETWIRADTTVTGAAEILALGTAEILFI
jgi:hypothetical protein